MVQLDHPTLEPFEPLIRRHVHGAFGSGLAYILSQGLNTAGDQWHTEAHRGFRAACLADFKMTQEVVGAAILDHQDRIMAAYADEAAARARRDQSAQRVVELRKVLEDRQLVLRRLMDSIVWVLTWPERWVLRRVRIEGGIRRIDSRLCGKH